MKKLPILLLACLFFACKKEKQENPFAGEWEWYKAISMVGSSTPQSTGKTWTLTLRPDMTASQAGTLFPVDNSVYSYTASDIRFHFTSLSGANYYTYDFQSSDSLILDSGSPHDSPIYYFVRKR